VLNGVPGVCEGGEAELSSGRPQGIHTKQQPAGKKNRRKAATRKKVLWAGTNMPLVRRGQDGTKNFEGNSNLPALQDWSGVTKKNDGEIYTGMTP